MKEIVAWDAARWSEWLSGSLSAYFSKGEGVGTRFAFRPLHTYMCQDYALEEDIVSIYSALPAEAKSEFKKGLQAALETVALTAENKDVVEMLLNVTVRLKESARAREFIQRRQGQLAAMGLTETVRRFPALAAEAKPAEASPPPQP